jgi:hypothetical protein
MAGVTSARQLASQPLPEQLERLRRAGQALRGSPHNAEYLVAGTGRAVCARENPLMCPSARKESTSMARTNDDIPLGRRRKERSLRARGQGELPLLADS